MDITVYTIGHSTRPIEEIIALLKAYKIEALIDVRTIAKSRHNPQYSEDVLCASLAREGITYSRMVELGGLRHAAKHSTNDAWRNASFRGYADYMQTPEFAEGVERLIRTAAQVPSAIMCAEAVPWRCHRSLIGDALSVRGVSVIDIISEKSGNPHKMTPFAHVNGLEITYPAAITEPSQT